MCWYVIFDFWGIRHSIFWSDLMRSENAPSKHSSISDHSTNSNSFVYDFPILLVMKCCIFYFCRSLLEQHMHCHREMIAVRSFKCPEKDCLFSGRSAAELRVHQNTHSDEKNYYCSIENCTYKTKTKALLNRLDPYLLVLYCNTETYQIFIADTSNLSIKQTPLNYYVPIVNSKRRFPAIWNDIFVFTRVKNHINVHIAITMPTIRYEILCFVLTFGKFLKLIFVSTFF